MRLGFLLDDLAGEIRGRTRLAHGTASSPVVEQRMGTSSQIAVVRLF